MTSDAALKDVLLAIAGDDAAFGRLVVLHQARLRALLRRVCGSAAVADDAAQAAFLKAWQNIGSLRDAGRFVPWLRRIALRAAVDAARAHGGDAESLGDAVNASAMTEADRKLDLEAALQRLSVAQRACVLMAYGEGMSHSEIASALHMPVGTVKSHVARGAALMRTSLDSWRDEYG